MDANVRGLAREWIEVYTQHQGGMTAPEALSRALFGLRPSEIDAAALAVAGDIGCALANVVKLEPAQQTKPADEEADGADVARQWRFATGIEAPIPAIILPVAMDSSRGFYDPGQLPLSIAALGMELFCDLICDLVAIPLDGGVPLSATGLTLAIGRFAVRERGEVMIYAAGISWLKAHLGRARTIGAECPAHLVPHQLEPPDHFCTLVLEPKAIEWRRQMHRCPLPPGTKSLMVRDSANLADWIEAAMHRKEKLPPRPKVFGPRKQATA